MEFSSPMRRGEALDHIHLITVAGDTVEFPFLDLEQELWDSEGKRNLDIRRWGRSGRVYTGVSLGAGSAYTGGLILP